MKRIKAMNGFTIYQYTKRDARDGHTIGEYCIFYSADVRELGTAYSTPEFEDLGTLAEALENIEGNYNGAAYSIIAEQTTCIDFHDVEELAARLENGGTITEDERDAADAAGVEIPADVETVEYAAEAKPAKVVNSIDFTSDQRRGIYRFEFVSDVTGGIRYCEINHDNRTYTTDYYRVNGGWYTSVICRLKDVKAARVWAVNHGYKEV